MNILNNNSSTNESNQKTVPLQLLEKYKTKIEDNCKIVFPLEK